MLIYSTAPEVTEPSAQFDPAMLAKSRRLQTVASVRTEFDPLSGWNQSLHIVLLLPCLVQSPVRGCVEFGVGSPADRECNVFDCSAVNEERDGGSSSRQCA